MTRSILTAACILSAFLAGFVAHAQGATAQERTDATRLWMQSVLRAEVPPRHVEVGTAPGNSGEALPDGSVRLAAWATEETPGAVWVRIHELAHRPENAACWGSPDSPERAVEEGIADALTRDLIPAAVRRFAPEWGWYRSDTVGNYVPEVSSIRYAIRSITGGNKGWGRAERLHLRKLWAASCPERQNILRSAIGE